MPDDNPSPNVTTGSSHHAAQQGPRKSPFAKWTLRDFFLVAMFVLIIAIALALLQNVLDGAITAAETPIIKPIADALAIAIYENFGSTGLLIVLIVGLFFLFRYIWRDARKKRR